MKGRFRVSDLEGDEKKGLDDSDDGLVFVTSHADGQPQEVPVPTVTSPANSSPTPVISTPATNESLPVYRAGATVPHASSVGSNLAAGLHINSGQRRMNHANSQMYRTNPPPAQTPRGPRTMSPSASMLLDSASEGTMLIDTVDANWALRSVHRGAKENKQLLEALLNAQKGVADSSIDFQATFTVLDSERKCRHFSGKQGFIQVNFEAMLDTGFFWIDVCAPSQADMTLIEQVFGIHPLTSEDILTEYTREKVEVYDSYLFTIMQTFSSTQGEDEQAAVNMNIAVFDTFAITFHARPAHVVNAVIGLLQKDTPLRADWTLMLIIDNIADELEPITRAAEVEVDAIDEMIFYLGQRDAADILRRITHIRRRTSRLIRILKPKRDILLYLTGHGRSPPPHVKKDTFLYFRDILDLIHEMMGKIEGSRETINATHSNYLAQLNVELAEATAASGTALNSLTVVSTLFLPLNLIAGSFGMNVLVPFQEADSLVPFFCIVLAMCLLSTVSIFWAKKKKLM